MTKAMTVNINVILAALNSINNEEHDEITREGSMFGLLKLAFTRRAADFSILTVSNIFY